MTPQTIDIYGIVRYATIHMLIVSMRIYRSVRGAGVMLRVKKPNNKEVM